MSVECAFPSADVKLYYRRLHLIPLLPALIGKPGGAALTPTAAWALDNILSYISSLRLKTVEIHLIRGWLLTSDERRISITEEIQMDVI
ncbi:uncharacterized protein LAESUDRAFT_814979 [Laetiporus sulphureus 93-53]|uniref:Uncharacterized protein n=1 Tax=Laetiporus sulphureus 93-53 TaxID=1314785 RepID=A0A165CKU9_9APHY|nr:uncharacterized protein LAESUDRAFT_814979 [Laetiporus sulphureus 93-53]KZT02991.1 hypothetical protein LAESUDRAFT_814979 [Laetiporus sulphureus 93-53]